MTYEHGDITDESTMGPGLADLQDCRSRISGRAILAPHTCTAADNELCHIFGQLSLWNEVLSCVRLELREYSAGRLSLVSSSMRTWEPENDERRHQAATLVYWLVKKHLCLEAVDLQFCDTLKKYQAIVSRGFREASSQLKRLKLGTNKFLFENIAPVMPTLTGLQELDFGQEDGVVFEHARDLITPLCSLLTTSPFLVTLSLQDREMNSFEARRFLHALANNNTLRALFINSSCLISNSDYLGALFAEFLEKNTVLSTLGMVSCDSEHLGKLSTIVEVLSHSRTLVNVSIAYFFVDYEASCAIERYLKRSTTVRSFNLENCWWYEHNRVYNTKGSGALSSRIRPWLAIIRENAWLEEITVNLTAFTPSDCVAFFDEVTRSPNLKKVRIEEFNWYCCSRGRQPHEGPHRTGVQLPLQNTPDVTLSTCKKLSQIHLSLHDEEDWTWFDPAVQALQTCDHITTVELDMWILQERVGSLIAGFVRAARAVRELSLCLFDLTIGPCVNTSPCKMDILRALSQNTSLRKLLFRTRVLTQEEAFLLAATVRTSRNIHDFQIDCSAESTEAFLNYLSPKFRRNVTLVSIACHGYTVRHTPDWFAVNDVVQRNLSLVTRAASFVVGHATWHGARALELVASNPALVGSVCQLALVDDQEAANMIQDHTKRFQGLHDFMRSTGIVQQHVICRKSKDNHLQLDHLDEYSWLCVRSYLRLADILRSSA